MSLGRCENRVLGPFQAGVATTKVPMASWARGLTLFHSQHQVRQQDGLVAMRTGCARAHLPTEDRAIRAALLSEIPCLAGRTLIDGRRPRGAWGNAAWWHPVTPAPGGLATGRGTDALAAHRCEGRLAHRARGRYANVTHRGVAHGGPLSSADRPHGSYAPYAAAATAVLTCTPSGSTPALNFTPAGITPSFR